MPVSKTACWQPKKDLGQRKQGQQHAHCRWAVTLLQGEQRRCHARASHTGVNTDLRENQAGKFRGHENQSELIRLFIQRQQAR